MSSVPTKSATPPDNTFENVITNDYFIAVVAILVVAYGQHAKLQVPNFMVQLFSNDIFRVFFLSLLLIVRFESRPTVAIILGMVFIYMLKYIQDQSSTATPNAPETSDPMAYPTDDPVAYPTADPVAYPTANPMA